MPEFTPEQYKAFEVQTHYQADRTANLKRYNEANGTNYQYYFEYVHKRALEGATCSEIAAPFGYSKTCIWSQLVKMGIARLPKGGRNNVKLTSEQVADILMAEGTHREIAKLLNIPFGNVSLIRSGRSWAGNKEVEAIIKRRQAT